MDDLKPREREQAEHVLAVAIAAMRATGHDPQTGQPMLAAEFTRAVQRYAAGGHSWAIHLVDLARARRGPDFDAELRRSGVHPE